MARIDGCSPCLAGEDSARPDPCGTQRCGTGSACQHPFWVIGLQGLTLSWCVGVPESSRKQFSAMQSLLGMSKLPAPHFSFVGQGRDYAFPLWLECDSFPGDKLAMPLTPRLCMSPFSLLHSDPCQSVGDFLATLFVRSFMHSFLHSFTLNFS